MAFLMDRRWEDVGGFSGGGFCGGMVGGWGPSKLQFNLIEFQMRPSAAGPQAVKRRPCVKPILYHCGD
jgi:hypothetical protein